MRKLKYIHTLLSFVLGVICFLLLNGCDVERRFHRMVLNNPELVNSADTTIYNDTTILGAWSHDTIFLPIKGQRDTFIINSPKGITRVYLNENKTKASVEQEFKADTLISTTQLIEKYVDTSELRLKRFIRKWIFRIGGGGLGLLILLFGFNYLRKTFTFTRK